jgi:hypothetical protein
MRKVRASAKVGRPGPSCHLTYRSLELLIQKSRQFVAREMNFGRSASAVALNGIALPFSATLSIAGYFLHPYSFSRT